MADNHTPVQAGEKQPRISKAATVAEEVALFFGTAAAKLAFVFAPIGAVLVKSALTSVGLGGPDVPAPLGSTLNEVSGVIFGFSVLWWLLFGLWWIFHYPVDPEHYDFDWYAIHAAFPALGLYVWALAPTVATLTISTFAVGSG